MNKIFPLLSVFYRHWTVPLIGLGLVLALFACGDQTKTEEKLAQETSSVQEVERDLTFNDVTLEQSDRQGRPIWNVKAKQATYSKDRRIAQVENPIGQLFQDGKAVYHINAKTGEIEQDGEKLFLKGQIVAKDPRNNLVLRGNELEWRPKEDLLIVRNNLTGNHPQVQAVAQEARVKTRAGIIQLQGQVRANTYDTASSNPSDPNLQMRTEHLIWRIREQKLIGDRPLQIDRYKEKKITDRATANSGEVNLKTKVTTLKQNAQLALLDPPMQIASNSISWNMDAETVTADRPVRLVQRQQQIAVTADKGRMDLQKEVVYLNGNVNGIGQRGQSLKAKMLTWYLPTQLMQANGDVFYRQIDPPASFTGQKAVGKLQDQNLAVSGGRVVTEIVPQNAPKTQ